VADELPRRRHAVTLEMGLNLLRVAEGEGPSLYVDDSEGNVVELKGPPW
jgi:hypothetical protein